MLSAAHLLPVLMLSMVCVCGCGPDFQVIGYGDPITVTSSFNLGVLAATLSLSGPGVTDLCVGGLDGLVVLPNVLNDLAGSGGAVLLSADPACPPRSMTLADLRGDQQQELVFGCSTTIDQNVHIFENPAGNLQLGQLPKVDLLGVETLPIQALSAADFDRDGRDDLVVAGVSLNNESVVRVLLSSLSNQPLDEQILFNPGLGPGGVPSAAATGDMNGDGRPDLLIAVEHQIHLFLDSSDAGDLVTAGYPISLSGVTGMVAVDINGDGILDVAAVNGQMALHLFLGLGNGSFQPELVHPLSMAPVAITAVPNLQSRPPNLLLGTANTLALISNAAQ